MNKQRVIVTIDRKKFADIDGLVERLEAGGLEITKPPDTVFTVTQITGLCDGDINRFSQDGVKCEPDGRVETK